MNSQNPPYATLASVNWKKIGFEILKYAFGAVLGGLGFAVSGCSTVPVFFF